MYRKTITTVIALLFVSLATLPALAELTPDPPSWRVDPTQVGPTMVVMEADPVTSDSGSVEYWFEQRELGAGSWDPSPEGWTTDPYWFATGLDSTKTYEFQFKARDAVSLDETSYSSPISVRLSTTPTILEVGGQYVTISAALQDALPGDIIRIHPDTYFEFDLHVDVSDLTITSEDPYDSDIVNGTVIDCLSMNRAFGVSANNVTFTGLTIRNGFADPNATNPGEGGAIHFAGCSDPKVLRCVLADCRSEAVMGSGDPCAPSGYGGGLFFDSSCSNVRVSECTLSGCIAQGGQGATGADGNDGQDAEVGSGLPGQDGTDGEDGKKGGNAYGGGIYLSSGVNGVIEDCVITGCIAQAGTGGTGGDGGDGGDGDNAAGGKGGAGGAGGETGKHANGAGIYFVGNSSAQEMVQIVDTVIENCLIRGTGGRGGRGGDGGSGSEAGIGGNGGDGTQGFVGGRGGRGGDGGEEGGGSIGGNGGNGGNGFVQGGDGGNGGDGQEAAGWGGNGGSAGPGGTPGQGGLGGYVGEDEERSEQSGSSGSTVGFYPEIDNKAVGLYVGPLGTVELYDSRLLSNQANTYKSWGGALYAVGCSLMDSKGVYQNNLGTLGGAVFLDASTNAEFHGSIFRSNFATNQDGGGIFFYGSQLTLDGCELIENHAGGADPFTTSWDAEGGGLFVPASLAAGTISIDASTFRGNSARYGGGIYLDSEAMTITDSRFEANTADYGAAGFWHDTANVVVEGCLVRDNYADLGFTGVEYGAGGGFYILDSSTVIRNSQFVNNVTDGYGGGVFFIGPKPGGPAQQIVNCLFTDNVASLRGGGLTLDEATDVTLSNCTIAHNQVLDLNGSGGGLSVMGPYTYATLQDSIVVNNTAVLGVGPQIGVGAPGYDYTAVLIANHNNVAGGEDYMYVSPNSTVFGWDWPAAFAEDNIDVDPLFTSVNPSDTTAGYYLSHMDAGQAQTSPLFDWGSRDISELEADANVQSGDLTSRTDRMPDTGPVDLGYHYPTTPRKFTVIIELGENGDAVQVGNDPNLYSYFVGEYESGQQIKIKAIPTPGYAVDEWSGGTVDDSTRLNVNYVVAGPDKHIKITFYKPNVIRVGQSDISNYAIIQDAINNSGEGDIIVVETGTWSGHEIQIDKNVVLRSLDPNDPTVVAATIIDRAGYATRGFRIGPNCDATTVISGFTVQNSSFTYNSGGTPTEACRDGEDATYEVNKGGAVLIDAGASPQFVNCIFRNNSIRGGSGGNGTNASQDCNAGRGGWGAPARGGAIFCEDNSSPTFINCRILNNSVRGGNGGQGGDDVANGGRANYGGNWSRSQWWNIRNQDDEDAGVGDALESYIEEEDLWAVWGRELPMRFQLTRDYRWWSGYGGGIYCDEGSTPTFVSCEISGNRTRGGFSGEGGTGSWAYGPQPEYSYEIPSFGGGVYCAANSNVSFYSCVFRDNIASDNTRLPSDHFYTDPYLSYGGAIATELGATVMLENCDVWDNQACVGGAIHWADGAKLVMKNTMVHDNRSMHGGALHSVKAEAEIVDCVIEDNAADIQIQLVPVVEGVPQWDLTNAHDDRIPPLPTTTTILGEGGGYLCSSTDADIINTVFQNNYSSAYGGAIQFLGDDQPIARPNVFNCLIVDNAAVFEGGAISANLYADPWIRQTTIVGNTLQGAQSYGGGIFVGNNAAAFVENCIIWDNQAVYGKQLSSVGLGGETAEIDIWYSNVGPLEQVVDANIVLDAVFCIDTTGSMGDDIAEVQDAAVQIVNAIAAGSSNYRIGVMGYKDFPDGTMGAESDPLYTDFVPFTNNLSIITAGINSMTAGGGADFPEAVYAGLMHALNPTALEGSLTLAEQEDWIEEDSPGLGQWRSGPNVRRMIILMGDAPPHIPENYTNYTVETIAAAARQGGQQTNIFAIPVDVVPETVDAFADIANATGGSLIEAPTSEQVVEAIIQAVTIATVSPTTVYAEGEGTVLGWDDVAGDWIYPDLIALDPNFIGSVDPDSTEGYKLTQIDAGQLFDSPCVDFGGLFADEVELNGVKMSEMTTRTDSGFDTGWVDLGYHYPLFEPSVFELKTSAGPDVIGLDPNIPEGQMYPEYTVVELSVADPCDENIGVKWTGTDDDTIVGPTNTVTMNQDRDVHVEYTSYTMTFNITDGISSVDIVDLVSFTITEDGNDLDPPYVLGEPRIVAPGAVIEIEIEPLLQNFPYRVKQWTGTDDPNSYAMTATATILGDVTIEVEFEQAIPRIIDVPGDYLTLQEAIDDARDGDTIVLAAATEPYRSASGYTIRNRSIEIRSTNPDDPGTVAQTVIQQYVGEGGNAGSGIDFYNVGPDTVLNGVTIRGFGYTPVPPAEPEDPPAGSNGLDGRDAVGGGIRCVSASPTIMNCVIENCNITGGNALDGVAGDETNRNGGDGGNPGGGFGGGIAIIAESDPCLFNCTFRNCSARGGIGGNGADGHSDGGDGGAAGGWYGFMGEPTDPFEKGGGYGGGAFIDGTSKPWFVGCNFVDCVSYPGTTGIGGLHQPSGLRRAPASVFLIDDFGGAVFCAGGSEPVFRDCVFNNNRADATFRDDPEGEMINEDEWVGFGGAVAVMEDSEPNFINCQFANNDAQVGGGLYADTATVMLTGGSFGFNTSSIGGGVYDSNSLFTIEGVEFQYNEATTGLGNGGGYYGFNDNSSFKDCTFIGNTANGSGGGLCFVGSSSEIPAEPSLYNCLVAYNFAGRDGGGISANLYAEVTIDQCTIADNAAAGLGRGGGLAVSYNSAAAVTNSIISRNAGQLGTQVFLGSDFEYFPMPSSLQIDYSNIDPEPRQLPLDLVICIATTSTMADDLQVIKDLKGSIFADLVANVPDRRVAIVDYRDYNEDPFGSPTDYPFNVVQSFVQDQAGEGFDGLDELSYGGFSGDADDSVYSALMYATDPARVWNDLVAAGRPDLHPDPCDVTGVGAWRSGQVNRVVLLIGDSDPHDPEPFTGYLLDEIVEATQTGEVKSIFTVTIQNGTIDPAGGFYDELAKRTGGRRFPASDETQIGNAIEAAISAIAKPQFFYIEDDCVVNGQENITHWDDQDLYGNLSNDPCFASGVIGEHFLSQKAAGQSDDSPCVDTADPSSDTFGTDYTTRTDLAQDVDPLDMGYHYPLMTTMDHCAVCDFDNDGAVLLSDLVAVAVQWLDPCCLPENDWCNGADFIRSYPISKVNMEDLAYFAVCWAANDDQGPYPNPARWERQVATDIPIGEPEVVDEDLRKIEMSAQPAWDNWGGPVEYYFDCVSGPQCSGADSGWITNPEYTYIIQTGTEYTWAVITRDQFGIESDPSVQAGISIEATPPYFPGGLYWLIDPTHLGDGKMVMEARDAIDPSGHTVEYSFDCISGPGCSEGLNDTYDRDWDTDPCFVKSGFVEGTFGFTVQARSTVDQEVSELSPIRYETISFQDIFPPTPDPLTWAVEPQPRCGGASMTATTAVDENAVQYFFDCISGPGCTPAAETNPTQGTHDSDWRSSPSWNASGLSNGSTYAFRVKARDTEGNEGGWSDPCSVEAGLDLDCLPPAPDGGVAGDPAEIGSFLRYLGIEDRINAVTATDDTEPVIYVFRQYDCAAANAGCFTGEIQSLPGDNTAVFPVSSGDDFWYRVTYQDSAVPPNTSPASAPVKPGG